MLQYKKVDRELLEEWNLKSEGISMVSVLVTIFLGVDKKLNPGLSSSFIKLGEYYKNCDNILLNKDIINIIIIRYY